MKKKSSAALRKRRQTLLGKLPPLSVILRGSLIEPTDPQLASMIVANMLENWLAFTPNALTTAEVTDEPENLRTAAEQTGLRLCASVDACPSAPPSGEHRASVCAATESRGTGLERNVDPHPRSRFGNIRCPHDGANGLQDPN